MVKKAKIEKKFGGDPRRCWCGVRQVLVREGGVGFGSRPVTRTGH
jgi:hypothetical protein